MVVSINWSTPKSSKSLHLLYWLHPGPRSKVPGVHRQLGYFDRCVPATFDTWSFQATGGCPMKSQCFLNRKPLQGFPVKFPLYQSIDIQNLEKNKGSFLEWPSKKSGPCMFRPSFILLFTCQMNRKNSALCILKTKKTEKNFQWDVQLRCCWLVNSTTETGRSHSHLWAAQMDLKKLIWAENWNQSELKSCGKIWIIMENQSHDWVENHCFMDWKTHKMLSAPWSS